MRITDESGKYQGWYQPQIGCFTQACALASLNSIKINQDVVETLRINGCKTIETSVVESGGHVEPYYLTFDKFMDEAKLEGSDLVFYTPDYENIDERREMRESLQP